MHCKRSIVHVDDDPAILRLVKSKLERLGIEVISVEEPREAIKNILSSDARVVLLDIDMPHVDGLTLLRDIKAHDGGLQVIMLTGMVSMTTVMQAMILGAEACVFKPVEDFQELTDALNAAFDKIDGWWTALYERCRRRGSESTDYQKA